MADEAYSDTALDHFHNPRNVGVMEEADARGHAENPASGAELDLYLRLDAGRITRATFKAQGCAATIAAASVATELLVGRSLTKDALTREAVMEALGGLPATKRHAAALVVDSVRSAASDHAARTNS